MLAATAFPVAGALASGWPSTGLLPVSGLGCMAMMMIARGRSG